MAILTARQKMGAAALVMGFSILVSRLMGLVRDKVISWQFGAGAEADIYFAAFVIPDFLNYLLAGGYISITLIPLLSELFERDDDQAWRFFSAVATWATLAIGTLSLVAWIAAPALTPIVAPGFDPDKQARLVTFLRIVLPAQVFFLPGACLSAILYVRRQFTVPALMPLFYNGMILLGGIALPRLGLANGMEGFCWGVTAGAAVGAFLMPLLTVRKDGLRFQPRLWHPQLKKFFLLALPLMIGQSVVVLDEQFIRIFGSLAQEGAVSLLNYARRIMMVPVGVVAQAAGVASFPFLAGLAANKQWADFDQTLNQALRNSLIVVIPITAWLVAAAGPTLAFIFQGGSFGAEHVAATTPLLQLMLLAVPFWAVQQITGRAFYARQDTLTPALVGTCATLLTIPVYFLLVNSLGAAGVAIVTSMSISIYALALVLVACKRWGVEAYAGLTAVLGKSLLLVAPGTLLTLALVAWLPVWLPNLGRLALQVLTLGLSGVLFCLVYLLMARILAPSYVDLLLSPFLRRLRRAKSKPKDQQ